MLYEEMTAAQARTTYEEFLAERPAGTERLRDLLANLGASADQMLDGSVQSLGAVQHLVVPLLKERPRPWTTSPTDGPTWARFDTFPPRLDVESTWLVDGVLSYFVDVVCQAVPGAEWRLGKAKTIAALARNRPLLTKGANYRFPPAEVLGYLQRSAFPLKDSHRQPHMRDLAVGAETAIKGLQQVWQKDGKAWADQVEVLPRSPADSADRAMLVTFDPDLVFECRPVLTTILRRFREEPGIREARWKGNRILVDISDWTADQLKAWWTANLEREFAEPI